MPRTDPVFEPVVNRRRMLTGGVALAVFAVATPACSPPPPPPPAVDELEAQLTLARHDSELATAAAAGASPAVTAALQQVAAERTQHAQALTAEIKRLAPTSSSSATSPTPTTSAVSAPPPPLATVISSLKGSADSAASLAAESSGYRAGLLGSIAAACTASHSVALAFGASAS
ncbi:hypothetical protein [Mycobacterium sp.]|uniref:hypothetical protein n=1 Tax=Mycobacterium sp. TaxID=1785 RepID=UPI0025F02234|nr:hypothetical protein [Mycobacterium sp.]